ncbi:hypothetical protein EDC96DRAFT_539569, partial [Choanephora cucurbitarum]
FFPHVVESAEEEGVKKFYMTVYEPHKARYIIKAVGDIDLLKKAEVFFNSKSPLMIAISGVMIQQENGQSFLGLVLEEKFHVKCSCMTFLPCLPLVPEALRYRLHPDVSPNQIQEGIKNGYFLTNLSMDQVFAVPDFREVEQEVFPNLYDVLDNSDTSLCSDGHAADACSSLDSDLYRSLVSTNLLDSSNLHEQGSVDRFGEGPSYSRLVTLPLPSSSPAEIRNALVTQIGQMRRELPDSLYLTREGREPMRSTSNVAAVRCRSNSDEFSLC